jgi:hypothetical protein
MSTAEEELRRIRVTEPQQRAGEDLPQIRIARSLAEVEALRPTWTQWKTQRDADIDFCIDLLWRGEPFVRPHVIGIYRDGQPDALLIGRLERNVLRPKIGYLRLPGIKRLSLEFPEGSYLGHRSAENSALFINSILQSLRAWEADSALLQNYPLASPISELARTLPGFFSRDHGVRPETRSLMKIAQSLDDVYRGFSSGLRADVRRKRKKLQKHFEDRAHFWTCHASSQFDEVLPQIEALARKSYQRRLGVGFRDTPEMRRHLQFRAQKGWLRIYLLSIDGQLCAYWIGSLYEGTFCSEYLAFDTAFARYSPGTVLLMRMVEDFCAEGVKEIDFGGGEGRYKERFGNSQMLRASVQIFAPTIKGLTLNAVHTATSRVNAAGKKLLGNAETVAKLKRLWRTQTPHNQD